MGSGGLRLECLMTPRGCPPALPPYSACPSPPNQASVPGPDLETWVQTHHPGCQNPRPPGPCAPTLQPGSARGGQASRRHETVDCSGVRAVHRAPILLSAHPMERWKHVQVFQGGLPVPTLYPRVAAPPSNASLSTTSWKGPYCRLLLCKHLTAPNP